MSTIREVAARAGVSIATVSRVMNNDTTYKITEETRDKVWRAIVELDYKAPAARHRSAASKEAADVRRVGCIISRRGKKYSDPYYLSILSAIEDTLHANHASVAFVRSWQELENSETLLSTFLEPPDGLIIMTRMRESNFRYALSKVPHVVGVDAGFPGIDNIEYDHMQSVLTGVTHLYQKGYRDIGFIGGPEGDIPMRRCRRFHGYMNTMADLGLPVREECIVDSGWNDTKCSKALFELGPDAMPRAFFVSSDLMALVTLRALSEMKIEVPGRVAVIGLTNLEISRYSTPALTTLDIPTEEMGAYAARTLLSRLNGEKNLPRRILFPTTLVVRDST